MGIKKNLTHAQRMDIAIDRMPHLTFRHHGIGVLQADLDRAGGERLHVWHPDLVKPGTALVHNHRFDMVSHVLTGEIHDVQFAVTPDKAGAFEVREVMGNGQFGIPTRANGAMSDKRHAAGKQYTIGAWTFHVTEAMPFSVTWVERDRMRATNPSVLVLRGDKPGDAFGDLPEVDIPAILAGALDGLKGAAFRAAENNVKVSVPATLVPPPDAPEEVIEGEAMAEPSPAIRANTLEARVWCTKCGHEMTARTVIK